MTYITHALGAGRTSWYSSQALSPILPPFFDSFLGEKTVLLTQPQISPTLLFLPFRHNSKRRALLAVAESKQLCKQMILVLTQLTGAWRSLK